MTANTPQSRKSKGRLAQQLVRKMILDSFPLEEDDVTSRSMGASGTDLHLSPLAQKYFPFDVEVKCQEKVRIWESWEQCKANATLKPLLVIKRNRQEPLVVMRFDDFLEILKNLSEAEVKLEKAEITDSNRKGDICEHLAILWLWEQGYEVFKNTGCTGPVDLVSYKDGNLKMIDVKSKKPTKNKSGQYDYSFSWSCLSDDQKEMGVKPLWVDPDRKIVGWNRDYFPEPE